MSYTTVAVKKEIQAKRAAVEAKAALKVNRTAAVKAIDSAIKRDDLKTLRSLSHPKSQWKSLFSEKGLKTLEKRVDKAFDIHKKPPLLPGKPVVKKRGNLSFIVDPPAPRKRFTVRSMRELLDNYLIDDRSRAVVEGLTWKEDFGVEAVKRFKSEINALRREHNASRKEKAKEREKERAKERKKAVELKRLSDVMARHLNGDPKAEDELGPYFPGGIKWQKYLSEEEIKKIKRQIKEGNKEMERVFEQRRLEQEPEAIAKKERKDYRQTIKEFEPFVKEIEAGDKYALAFLGKDPLTGNKRAVEEIKKRIEAAGGKWSF